VLQTTGAPNLNNANTLSGVISPEVQTRELNMYDKIILPAQRLQLFSTRVGVSQWILTEQCAALVSIQTEPTNAREVQNLDMAVITHPDEAVISIEYRAGGERVAFLMDMWSDKTLALFSNAFDCMPVAFFSGSGQFEFADQGQQLGHWEHGMAAMIELRKEPARRLASEYLQAAFSVDLIAHYAIHPNQANRNANGQSASMSVTVLVDDSHLAGFPQRR
jgi:hypothetical protein